MLIVSRHAPTTSSVTFICLLLSSQRAQHRANLNTPDSGTELEIREVQRPIRLPNQVMFGCGSGDFRFWAEEVVQVYGICIRTLHLPVISVMIIGVMRLSYNERAVSEGRFRHHLFQAVFVRTSYPSRYVYFRWSRVHKAVETAVTATVVM